MMQTPEPAAIREWHDVSPALFHEQIRPLNQPAVLRGAIRAWPAVRAGEESAQRLVDYLLRFDRGTSVEVSVADPSVRGRIFYKDDLSGFNFEVRKQRLADVLRGLLAVIDSPEPDAQYVGSQPVADCLPGFSAENVIGLLPPTLGARLWVGNRVTVHTHYDAMENLACVVAGRRRFTLFPPEQLRNLYLGPLEFTPGGTPVSMVKLEAPDYARYPRFREALASAQRAELSAGDVLYIPYMWWHHVEGLSPFNMLINYWWVDTPAWAGAPFSALIHALLSVRALPADKRAVWRDWFDHIVFQTEGDPAEHLPLERRGVLSPPSAAFAAMMRSYVLSRLTHEQRADAPPPRSSTP
jgi:hypothetical protein